MQQTIKLLPRCRGSVSRPLAPSVARALAALDSASTPFSFQFLLTSESDVAALGSGEARGRGGGGERVGEEERGAGGAANEREEGQCRGHSALLQGRVRLPGRPGGGVLLAAD